MIYIVMGDHSAEVCPTSNARTRELLMKSAPEMPKLAQKHGVKIIAGPLVNHEHLTVMIAETPKAESLHEFILETGFSQWNKVHVLPAQSLEDGIKEMDRLKPIF